MRSTIRIVCRRSTYNKYRQIYPPTESNCPREDLEDNSAILGQANQLKLVPIDMLKADWSGPFSWPGFEPENGLSSVPEIPGIYLFTVKSGENEYLIYAAGFTQRPIPKRLREHTGKYRNGDYNILDPECMSYGHRRLIWKGWGWSEEKRAEYEIRKDEILTAADRQLCEMRLFVSNMTTDRRLLARVEGAIMKHLDKCEPPMCNIPDVGMSLSTCWENEEPITMKNSCSSVLRGLPDELSI